MNKKSLFLLIILIVTFTLAAEKRDTLNFSLSGGIILDVAPFGLEKKFVALGTTVQLPFQLSPGIKPQFAFNNDMWSFYIPAILSVPIDLNLKNSIVIEPYGGGGVVYHSDLSSFVPLIEGGLMIRKDSVVIDIPIYGYFTEFNRDFLIGFNVGWSI